LLPGKTLEEKNPKTSDDRGDLPIGVFRNKNLVTVDLDTLDEDARDVVAEEIAEMSDFPLFQGTVEHAYTKRFVDSTAECPRCGAPTSQQLAGLIYATDSSSRSMMAPAGFFCSACPTVIIDEENVAAGVKPGYKFRRVVGVDHGQEKDPDYFATWNSKKPTYILDENGQIMDLVTEGDVRRTPTESTPLRKNIKKSKRKRKLARQARRRNRR
jgi:hypothetical protein